MLFLWLLLLALSLGALLTAAFFFLVFLIAALVSLIALALLALSSRLVLFCCHGSLKLSW
ncbi:MAG: hypothetical protein JWO73_269 [Candidatus Taylorbacteria bacterium]|nr:hypothetical protein [Candidatus Taylorbacteria bacterium]